MWEFAPPPPGISVCFHVNHHHCLFYMKHCIWWRKCWWLEKAIIKFRFGSWLSSRGTGACSVLSVLISGFWYGVLIVGSSCIFAMSAYTFSIPPAPSTSDLSNYIFPKQGETRTSSGLIWVPLRKYPKLSASPAPPALQHPVWVGTETGDPRGSNGCKSQWSVH